MILINLYFIFIRNSMIINGYNYTICIYMSICISIIYIYVYIHNIYIYVYTGICWGFHPMSECWTLTTNFHHDHPSEQGHGRWSYRFTETLNGGAIPVAQRCSGASLFGPRHFSAQIYWLIVMLTVMVGQ
jgi:hypothetical protein